MHILTETSSKISRKVEDVYSFATNMENFEQWFPEVIEIKPKKRIDEP
ncbi:hypothetical protein [Chengkuizengella axinellae]|uniref:SRPBCC family protein n=1 Tax=Chengkuizengella axinellae TaxID=3064388 RepID=A0ABT9IX54_9BACL|nr:hypothetical protein [Chengkuizengella sp. 2205SS18-9]MDP5273389.1 hypothetical protein [Chengkuizengella sp. 2205SS18-9]